MKLLTAVVEVVERFRLVCSWCSGVLDEGPLGARVSHVLCPICEVKYFPVR